MIDFVCLNILIYFLFCNILFQLNHLIDNNNYFLIKHLSSNSVFELINVKILIRSITMLIIAVSNLDDYLLVINK